MNNIFLDPLQRFAQKVVAFLPNLLISIIIIAIGFLIALVVRMGITKISVVLKLDRLSGKIGIEDIIRKCGIKEPVSQVLGKAAFWVILISFVIMGLDSLRMLAVETLLEEFWLYLPNVFASAIIVSVGYFLGNFLGRAALIASVNAGLSMSGLIGKFVKFTVFIMAATMALELLGIGKETVLIAFAIVFGGVVLALSLAFGLGGRDAAKGYIDKMLKEKKDEDDISHI